MESVGFEPMSVIHFLELHSVHWATVLDVGQARWRYFSGSPVCVPLSNELFSIVLAEWFVCSHFVFQIHTQVASLTLYTCQGDELMVENLTKSEVINIMLPHQPDEVIFYVRV